MASEVEDSQGGGASVERHPMAIRAMNLIFVFTDSMRSSCGATTQVFQNLGAVRPNPVRCDPRGNLPGPHRRATA